MNFGDASHLFDDATLGGDLTTQLDVKEHMKTREQNAREERSLLNTSKIIDRAVNVKTKAYNYELRSLRKGLFDIHATTPSLQSLTLFREGSKLFSMSTVANYESTKPKSRKLDPLGRDREKDIQKLADSQQKLADNERPTLHGKSTSLPPLNDDRKRRSRRRSLTDLQNEPQIRNHYLKPSSLHSLSAPSSIDVPRDDLRFYTKRAIDEAKLLNNDTKIHIKRALFVSNNLHKLYKKRFKLTVKLPPISRDSLLYQRADYGYLRQSSVEKPSGKKTIRSTTDKAMVGSEIRKQDSKESANSENVLVNKPNQDAPFKNTSMQKKRTIIATRKDKRDINLNKTEGNKADVTVTMGNSDDVETAKACKSLDQIREVDEELEKGEAENLNVSPEIEAPAVVLSPKEQKEDTNQDSPNGQKTQPSNQVKTENTTSIEIKVDKTKENVANFTQKGKNRNVQEDKIKDNKNEIAENKIETLETYPKGKEDSSAIPTVKTLQTTDSRKEKNEQNNTENNQFVRRSENLKFRHEKTDLEFEIRDTDLETSETSEDERDGTMQISALQAISMGGI